MPKPNYLFMLWVMILFTIGILFIVFNDEEKYRESKIYQRLADDFENKVKELDSRYKV
jgi:cbb3-type cytochrome oxidase subunit 3